MHRELLLLGLLQRGDMHGYKLNEFIERELSVCTDLKKATAYFVLEKLEKAGLIAYYSEQEGNRPPRRVYRLTPAGEQEFHNLLRENLATHEPARFTTDIGLAFADALPPDEVLTLLKKQLEAMQADLVLLRRAVPHKGMFQLIIDHRIVHLESEIRWLEGVMVFFEQRSADQASDQIKGTKE